MTDYYNTISSNPAIAKKNIDAWDYKNNPEYHYQYIKGNLSQNKNTFVSRVPIGMMALYRAPKASANAFDSNYKYNVQSKFKGILSLCKKSYI